jgi:hypothetical protein
MTTKNLKQKESTQEEETRKDQVYIMNYLYITHRIVDYYLI